MASEHEIMAAVLRQLLVTKLDFQRLADDTGLSSAEAARSRWRRIKAKLEGCDSSPEKTSVTVLKNRNGKRKECMDNNDNEDNDKGRVETPKRGRDRPRGASAEKKKVVVEDDDGEEEA